MHSGSLMQKDAEGRRTPAEVASFGAALRTMGVWYGSKLTTTVILSELPEGWPRTPADEKFFPPGWLQGKGWPTFERAMSGMVKGREARTAWPKVVDPSLYRKEEGSTKVARRNNRCAGERPDGVSWVGDTLVSPW